MNILVEIFISFFKIGAFTFGGGYAMLPLIEKEVVDKKQWLTKAEFVDMLAIVQTVPGPIAINTAVYIGYKRKGFLGALSSVLGASLPSFVIILLVAMVFTDIQNHPTIQKIFKGIRPAVVALILAPVVRLAKVSGVNWKTLFLPILAVIFVAWLGVSPIWVIIGAAIIGLIVNCSIKKS